MATSVDAAKGSVQDTQKQYFRVTDRVPEQVWYWAALGSIIVSASLFVMGKRDWSMFVGQWPPIFPPFRSVPQDSAPFKIADPVQQKPVYRRAIHWINGRYAIL